MTTSSAPLTADKVRTVTTRIADKILPTPTLPSEKLSRLTNANVFVKYENLQYTGSFKARGAIAKLTALTREQAAKGIITMSAGNHAQGVAFYAGQLGIPATIVMPEATPFIKVRAVRDYGATVVLEGEGLSEAAKAAEKIAHEKSLTIIHPYNDDEVISGQGGVAFEMLAAVPALDMLVIPVGGGGLISGCAIAAKSVKPSIEIIGVETELYPSMINITYGEHRPVGGSTLAEGIAVRDIGSKTAPIVKQHVRQLLAVSETGIERSIALFATHCKAVAEGAGAASLAALLEYPDLFRGRNVGLVLSGGNAGVRMLSSVLMRSLVRNHQVLTLSLEMPDKPGQLHLVSGICAEEGANVLEVSHTRSAMDLSAISARLAITIETRDEAHANQVKDRLRAAGFTAVHDTSVPDSNWG